MKKIIVILGPTASGKSDLAVRLAKQFNGEIVSADSRQVYRGLNIGSGKITKKEMRGVPHHLLDVASPTRRFTAAQFQKKARAVITVIQKNGNVPFLVGGTGFYIQAVVDGVAFPEVPPNQKLRRQLQKKSVAALFLMLKEMDPKRAGTIDAKNSWRLIRAIEIIQTTGKPIAPVATSPRFDTLQIGIQRSQETLSKAIRWRLQKRLRQGMVAEVAKLHRQGLSWRRLEELGLEYRYVAQYLQRKCSKQEMMESIQKESEHFAKRQMTWFKRDKRIHWISTPQKASRLIKKFLQ